MSISKCPVYPVTWTEGDQLPGILGVLKDVDITGWTIQLKLDRSATIAADTLTKTATIVDGPNGQFSFAWAAGDLLAGVGQLTTVTFTNTLTEPQTPARFLVNVDSTL